MGRMDGDGNAEPREARAKAAARAASWQAWGAVLGIAAGYAAPWVMPWMFRSILADERHPAALTAMGAGMFAWAGMLGYGRRIWRREVAGKEEEKGWRRGWKLLAFLWGFLLVGFALLAAGFVGFPGFMALAVAVGTVSRKYDGGEDFWNLHRQAEVRIGWGGLGLIVTIVSQMVVDRWGWAQTWAAVLPFALAVAGVALILAGLWDVAGRGRRVWVGGAAAALAVLVAAQALSGLAVQQAQEEADKLLQEVLARCGEVPQEEARPPVAEAEDRLAGLADLQAEREDWMAFAVERMRRERAGRLHPEGAEEREYVCEWVAGHPGLAAVAEALADPGYRSCLEGGHIAGEAATGVAETSWQEPRMEAAKAGAGILELRARLAFEDGNAAGGMADVERLWRLAERMERETWALGAIAAEGMRDAVVRHVLAETIGAWPEKALEAAVREEANLAVRGAEDWRRWAARKIAIGDLRCIYGLPGVPKSFAAAFGCGTAPELTGNTHARNFWMQRDRCNLLRDWAWTLDALERVEAAPPGEERDAAWVAYEEEAERRAWAFPLLTAGIGGAKGVTWRRMLFDRRTRAEFVRAAVTLERWRRSHDGELPASLEEVAPMPRDAWSGDPLAYEPGPLQIPEEHLLPAGGTKELTFPVCELPGWRLGWPAWKWKEGRRERMVGFLAGE
jgi:hypothetical protein